jgi:hypothetical protein
MKKLSSVLFSAALLMPFTHQIAQAAPLPINLSSAFTAQIPSVGQIWKGEIPTSISFPTDAYSGTIEFPIEGTLPFKILSDRANGVKVEFEIWAESGKKLGSETVYSFSWNPVGPKTLVSISLYPDAALFGTQTMIVRTIYQTSTTGLLSRYLQDEQKIQLQINKSIPSKVPDAPTKLAGSLNGTSVDYTFEAPVANPQITHYEIAISTLITPNQSPENMFGWGAKTIIKNSSANSFSINKDDINNYYKSGYATQGSPSILITVRAVNSLGSSNWSNGVYSLVSSFGLKPYVKSSTPIPKTTNLICVKGKVQKIVTGSNPKCPTGFKKKQGKSV